MKWNRASMAFVAAVALVLTLGTTQAFAAANYYTPVGTQDRADCSRVAGWAKDGDTTLPIQVHIYKGAAYPYGQYVTAVVANKYRSDLPFADKYHGFDMATPSAFKTGCPEKIYIHAINVDTNGNIVYGATNPLLSGTGTTIYCGPPDPSCFEGPEHPGGP
jgi:hypothetical protein